MPLCSGFHPQTSPLQLQRWPMHDQPRRRTRSSTRTNCLKRFNWNTQTSSPLGATAKPPIQTVVGFALETDEGTASAQSKLERKKADFIVLNSTSVPGAGFETDTNQVLSSKRRQFP